MKTALKESFYQHRRSGITHQGSLRVRNAVDVLLLIFALETFFSASLVAPKNLKVFSCVVIASRHVPDLRPIFVCLHAPVKD